jgi:hypothetical protein
MPPLNTVSTPPLFTVVPIAAPPDVTLMTSPEESVTAKRFGGAVYVVIGVASWRARRAAAGETCSDVATTCSAAIRPIGSGLAGAAGPFIDRPSRKPRCGTLSGNRSGPKIKRPPDDDESV